MSIPPRLAFALALTFSCLSGHVLAQGFPAKPIRLLAYSGGAVEALMRQVGQEMQANWGQPLVWDNRPGANGMIAGEACARANADGYTLCMVAPSFLVLPLTNVRVPFDLGKDFAPVTNVVYTVLGLAVHPSLGANNLKDLVAVARNRPGQLNRSEEHTSELQSH